MRRTIFSVALLAVVSFCSVGVMNIQGAESGLTASSQDKKNDDKRTAQGQVPQIKEIKLGPTFVRSPGQGRYDSPKTISNKKELEKAFAGPTAQKSVKKHLDFKTQKLVLFSWSGSGQDSIQAKVVKVEKPKPKTDSTAQPTAKGAVEKKGSTTDSHTTSKETTTKIKPEYQIVFQYTGGRTRDFRRHIHAFVIPKEISFSVQKSGSR